MLPSLTGGPAAASTLELLAELLDPGDAGRFGPEPPRLADLARRLTQGEAALLGLGETSLRRLGAAFELARRRLAEDLPARPAVPTAASAFALLRPAMADEPVEVFRVVLLDARNRVLAAPEVARGTLTASLVHPREVFRPALAAGAASVLVAHNHPSGDETPSAEDDAVTSRLARAGGLLGIPLLDHLVVGDARYWSYRERRSDLLVAG